MRRLVILAAAVAASIFGWSVPEAAADGWHRHGGHGRVGIYFGVPGPSYYYVHRPWFYDPYYVHRPPRTVVVERPVYYPAPTVQAAPPVGLVPREGRDSSGNYCREYQSTATIDGRPVPTYGTACLRPDGAWQIVN
jgi:hypothetical protein